jgi:hypothetical protein
MTKGCRGLGMYSDSAVIRVISARDPYGARRSWSKATYLYAALWSSVTVVKRSHLWCAKHGLKEGEIYSGESRGRGGEKASNSVTDRQR